MSIVFEARTRRDTYGLADDEVVALRVDVIIVRYEVGNGYFPLGRKGVTRRFRGRSVEYARRSVGCVMGAQASEQIKKEVRTQVAVECDERHEYSLSDNGQQTVGLEVVWEARAGTYSVDIPGQ